MNATEGRKWSKLLAKTFSDVEPTVLVGAVALRIANEVGCDLGDAVVGEAHAVTVPKTFRPASGWANPWLLGWIHEQAVGQAERSDRGAWYTPEPVVRGLVHLATKDNEPPQFLVDPTCGGGAFLLAGLDRLVEMGVKPGDAFSRVAGQDIDPVSVRTSILALKIWAHLKGVTGEPDLSLGDALVELPEHWPGKRVVVGNPPFATPLKKGALPEVAAAFRAENDELFGPYADLSAMHLWRMVSTSAAGSTVAFVQPQSVLANRDVQNLRKHLDAVAPMRALWVARESVFDANVKACAPVLAVGAESVPVLELASGRDVVLRPKGGPTKADKNSSGENMGTGEKSWAAYAAEALGTPQFSIVSGGQTLGDMATATAGFRDEYYGLLAACHEWPSSENIDMVPNRLLTTGAINALSTHWGIRQSVFGKKRWQRPYIDPSELEGKVLAWFGRQMKPKVVLATQSKVLEPVLDSTGQLVPVTPLIAVHANADELAHIAAALVAPPCVVWAQKKCFGSALAVDALKLSAKQVVQLPLPGRDRTSQTLWDRAAALIPAADVNDVSSLSDEQLFEIAALMNAAYGGTKLTLNWWANRSGIVLAQT